MKAVTYEQSVFTLASCHENYDTMTKEQFALEVLLILKKNGAYTQPKATKNG